MKHPRLAVSLLACSLLAAIPFVHAEGGRIAFTGSILEQGCPIKDGALDCPPGRRAAAIVRPLDTATARHEMRATLFAYALQRDRSASWQVMEVTYP